MPEKWVLRQYQSLPLRAKVGMTESRIIEWYNHFMGDVCVSFSGGKDSTVLAHLVRKYYPHVPLVFANTGLEYPEIQAFARKMGAEFVRPKMRFDEVISKYGYPIISKEVAEAIYYARRIVHQKPENVDITERERESTRTTARKQSELQGTRTDTAPDGTARYQTSGKTPVRTHTHTHSVLTGHQSGDGRTSRTRCQTSERVQENYAIQTATPWEGLTFIISDEKDSPG